MAQYIIFKTFKMLLLLYVIFILLLFILEIPSHKHTLLNIINALQ